ncbi:MAG: HAMP domain-containing protein [Spirochaetes bacterium]|nr:HAMP domain-containing protein [Spirochaetota bacterium]
MWFFKQPEGPVRKVYFGLRSRALGLLTLVIIFIISVFTLVLFFFQTSTLKKEMEIKAETLTKILHNPSEFYLDNDIETSSEELKMKLDFIKKEAGSFKSYNEDIIKIILTDEKGNVKFSTFNYDYKRKDIPFYIKKVLEQDEDTILHEKYRDAYNDQDKGGKEYRNNYAFTIPIFLKTGITVEILSSFNENYMKYHDSKTSEKEKKQIYARLFSKYKSLLGEEFDPAYSGKTGTPQAKQEIKKAGDIDFLFMKLFSEIMKTREKRINRDKRKLWTDSWLIKKKQEKLNYYEKDRPSNAKDVHDEIITNLSEFAAAVESTRRLGAIAIVFNEDMRKKYRFQNIGTISILALCAIGFSILLFLFMLNYTIRNLKLLENWAVSVSNGNLETKIEIETNDEIGRLGDVFNHMLDEIIVKYKLEKFLSSSAVNMIRKNADNTISLGATYRKNLAFMFSDVRGFTSFSEKNEPEKVIEVLNFYLELQSEIIHRARGDINDYVGDEIMAHFSDSRKNDTAIRTAVKIMTAIKEINRERSRNKLPVFEVGIGLHSGDVVAGNVGSKQRMDFACVGDAVNLTSRLCHAAAPGEIIVSEEMFKKAKGKYKHQKMEPLQLKGKTEKIKAVKILI